MYKLTYTEKFRKHYKKLHQYEKKHIKRKIDILVKNPIHPSLRSKRIQGTDTLFESSVNMDIRVIWYYKGEQMIILVYVGHHDILNHF